MPAVAVVGNLARDIVDGGVPTAGGCPRFALEAFRRLGRGGQIVTRFRADDGPLFAGVVEGAGADVTVLDGRATSGFALDYHGEQRAMRVTAVGETWRPADAAALDPDVRWVHVAPLLRTDFPPETLRTLAEGRRLSLDGQGLVRAPTLGPLALDADYEPALLAHVTALKLSEEEACVVAGGSFGREAAARLGVPEIVLTLGSRGAVVFTPDGVTAVPAAWPVLGVQTTGAGDVFMVGYAVARADGADPVRAAKEASRVVAEVLDERPRASGV